MKENTEWDVLAAVMLREVETGGSEQREILWQGPLAEAICYFMDMPENKREPRRT
jgi:hypothetical protein